MELLLYLGLGTIAGILAGLFGVGGGLIIVPALVFSFTTQGFSESVLTQMALGSSLATIIFTSINAVRAHAKRQAVLWPIAGWMSLGILIGAALGALTASSLQGALLQKIIGLFALLMAAQMFFNLAPKTRKPIPNSAGLAFSGSLIGWASAIFGIGGGSLSVPFLSWRSIPIQQAVATSSACGFPIACAGTLGFMWVGWQQPELPQWSFGYLYLPAVVGIASTSMFTAHIGARWAHRLSPVVLKRLFSVLLCLVGLSFIV